MDIESARKNLKLAGYVHPESTNTNRDSRYKTFSETDKKKKSHMDKFKSVAVGKQYASLATKIDEADTICPVCKEKAIDYCDCVYSDKKCKEGHVWYIDREGETKVGNPH